MNTTNVEGAGWRGVADLYHDVFLGLVLTVLSRKSEADAAEFVFNTNSPEESGLFVLQARVKADR